MGLVTAFMRLAPRFGELRLPRRGRATPANSPSEFCPTCLYCLFDKEREEYTACEDYVIMDPPPIPTTASLPILPLERKFT